MGNKLVCCRWRWIESPEFATRLDDTHGCKYASGSDNYPNGYVNHVANMQDNGCYGAHKALYPHGEVENTNKAREKPGYIVQDLQNNHQPNNFPVSNFVCPGPFYPNSNSTKQPYCYQNSLGLYQQMDSSGRDSWMVKSTEQLQHISEREPEDVDNDPSINAKNPTMFLKRSKDDIELNLSSRRHENEKKKVPRGLRQWSSCSSILLDDTTISQPNPALSLKTLALAIHLHVRVEITDDRYRCSHEDAVYSIFDERIHPVVRQGSHSDLIRGPSHREIYRFLRGIFNMAQLTPECAIVTLVYLERLLSSAEMEIMSWTWRRQLLASVLLASKVWDDQAVWNADYCQILKDLCVEDVNELERSFLELIQFNINVPSSVYAHYYFDLLQLGRNHGLYNQSSNHRPLSWDRAVRLEAVNCPPGPLDDYASSWWTRPRPLTRFQSWDSVNGTVAPQFRRMIIS